MCSASDFDRSEKVSGEQAEKLVTGDKTDGNPQSAESDQVLSSAHYCYKVSAFPQTYQEAIESPESKNWKAAMREEMDSLILW